MTNDSGSLIQTLPVTVGHLPQSTEGAQGLRPPLWGSLTELVIGRPSALRPKSSASEACFGLSSSVRSAPCPKN